MTGARSRSRGRVRRPGPAAAVGLQLEEAQNVYTAQDWSAIAVGSAVEVILPEGPAYRGRVDAKTPDSRCLGGQPGRNGPPDARQPGRRPPASGRSVTA
ncbi:hypothetical protein QF047_004219 [Arthrobacter sp. W4I7]|nr:hypothetical protein [Arthrobacter sp. W4I7]